MTKLSATEKQRVGNRVYVSFISDDARPVVYGRYVDAADWDKDSIAVISQVYDYLAKLPAPVEPELMTSKASIVVTSAQATAKLEDMKPKVVVDVVR